MKILLLNLPVHIPTVMPYSLAMMHSVLVSQFDEEIKAIDLNSYFHFKVFPNYYKQKKDNFFRALDKFEGNSRGYYPGLSKASRENRVPENYELLLKKVIKEKPDIVCISFTYNSQLYFAKFLIDDLIKKGVKVIVGGPADYSKLDNVIRLENYTKLGEYLDSIGARRHNKEKKAVLDFSGFEKKEYFTKDIVYPLRTAVSCPYKRCTFCTHHGNMPYRMIDLDFIRESIIKNKMKKICFIDDDFPIVRIKELGGMLKPLDIKWWCQLRPVRELIPLFPMLYESGLRSISFGVESGCQRILDKMEKGTVKKDISDVLKASKDAGMINLVYVMFGLPGETEKEFIETVEFLEENKKNIDLLSLSVFGLQKGSRIYDAPGEFGVKHVELMARTIYGEKVIYEPEEGMTQAEAKELKFKMKGRLNRINKIPSVINSCKEQVLNL